MFRQLVMLSVLVLLGLGLMSTGIFDRNDSPNAGWNEATPVADVLHAFGEDYPDHRPEKVDPELIRQGRELVTEGVTTGPDGKLTRVQSRYFSCTNCHNIKKEDPDLRFSDPDKRLDYAKERDLALLQGTTMYGTVNKVSWYNGDYYIKYGDLVKPANSSLVEAIKLCSVVCSQGRYFEDWEMKAVLAYFWSIQLKLGDLALTSAEWDAIHAARKKGGDNPEMAKLIQSYYLSGSPATFTEGPEDKNKGYETERSPDPARGKMVYDMACLACHDQQGPSKYLKLDHGNLSMGLFRRNLMRKGHLSLYDIIRHGTYADKGHRAYMPHFTGERMSNQQVEDLRAYVMLD